MMVNEKRKEKLLIHMFSRVFVYKNLYREKLSKGGNNLVRKVTNIVIYSCNLFATGLAVI